MKKLLLILSLLIPVCFMGQGYSKVLRVTDASTAFGRNVNQGTIIVNLATDNVYLMQTSAINTATLTSLTEDTDYTLIGGASGSDVSVANQSDNRLITATATTDALNAESELTFTSSELNVNATAPYISISGFTNTGSFYAYDGLGTAYVSKFGGSQTGDLFGVAKANNSAFYSSDGSVFYGAINGNIYFGVGSTVEGAFTSSGNFGLSNYASVSVNTIEETSLTFSTVSLPTSAAVYNFVNTTDNQIVVGTGTGIEGDANFTWDATTLTVNSSGSTTKESVEITGAIQVGTSSQTTPDAGTMRWNGTNFQGYDGAGWDNLDESGGGVTINNNTDNYLLTATGTANTINGESTLTYDGIKLEPTGAISLGDYNSGFSGLYLYYASNTPKAIVGNWDNTTTGSTVYGSANFYNSNTTSNNFAGFIFSDNYNPSNKTAGIFSQISDHTNNYGNIEFWTNSSGGFNQVLELTESKIGVFEDILPATTNTYDLGSTEYKFAELHSDNIHDDGTDVGLFTTVPESNVEINGSMGEATYGTIVTTSIDLSSGNDDYVWYLVGGEEGSVTFTLPSVSSTGDRTYYVVETGGAYGFTIAVQLGDYMNGTLNGSLTGTAGQVAIIHNTDYNSIGWIAFIAN